MIQEFIDKQNNGLYFHYTKDRRELIMRVIEVVKKDIEYAVKDISEINRLTTQYFDNKNIEGAFRTKEWMRNECANSIIVFMINSGKYKDSSEISQDILKFEGMEEELSVLKNKYNNIKQEENNIPDKIKKLENVENEINKIAEFLSPEAIEDLLFILDDYKKLLSK